MSISHSNNISKPIVTLTPLKGPGLRLKMTVGALTPQKLWAPCGRFGQEALPEEGGQRFVVFITHITSQHIQAVTSSDSCDLSNGIFSGILSSREEVLHNAINILFALTLY